MKALKPILILVVAVLGALIVYDKWIKSALNKVQPPAA